MGFAGLGGTDAFRSMLLEAAHRFLVIQPARLRAHATANNKKRNPNCLQVVGDVFHAKWAITGGHCWGTGSC
jgi:hypothetical protein